MFLICSYIIFILFVLCFSFHAFLNKAFFFHHNLFTKTNRKERKSTWFFYFCSYCLFVRQFIVVFVTFKHDYLRNVQNREGKTHTKEKNTQKILQLNLELVTSQGLLLLGNKSFNGKLFSFVFSSL